MLRQVVLHLLHLAVLLQHLVILRLSFQLAYLVEVEGLVVGPVLREASSAWYHLEIVLDSLPQQVVSQHLELQHLELQVEVLGEGP